MLRLPVGPDTEGMGWRPLVGAVVLLLVAGSADAVRAQAMFSSVEVVESTEGGFAFPDGTVQATSGVEGDATPGAPVEATGQRGCWNALGSLVSCLDSGHDGELRAGVEWPKVRFRDNGDGTVTDQLTDLTWLQDANCFGTVTWSEALSAVKDLNSTLVGDGCANYVGFDHTDWRLANIEELKSLLDFGRSDPALPEGHPFSNVQSGSVWYWSSTTEIGEEAPVGAGGDEAWACSFLDGLDVGFPKTDLLAVWPVRGGVCEGYDC